MKYIILTLLFLSILIMLLVFARVIYKKYKKYVEATDEIERAIYGFLLLAFLFLLIIYWFDYANIPTKYGLINKWMSKEWVGLLITFFSTVFSALISSAFLMFITLKQVDLSRADNMDITKEQTRLNNMPKMRYCFNNVPENPIKTIIPINCDYDTMDTLDAVFNVKMKNVGLGALQNVWYSVVDNDYKHLSRYRNGDVFLSKEMETTFSIIFKLPKIVFSKYFCILIYYEDMLNNVYVQKIDCSVNVSKNDDNYSAHIFSDCTESAELMNNDVLPNKIIEQLDSLKQSNIEQQEPETFETADKILDNYVGSYEFISTFLDSYFSHLKFTGGVGALNSIHWLKGNNYCVSVLCSRGKKNEFISLNFSAVVNVKTREISKLKFSVIDSTLKISKLDLFEFKLYLIYFNIFKLKKFIIDCKNNN